MLRDLNAKRASGDQTDDTSEWTSTRPEQGAPVDSRPASQGKTSNVANRLLKIAKDIKAIEKRTVQNVIEIGRLLHEASETCEHGEYEDCVAEEFCWSDQAALNYRNVYEFNANPSPPPPTTSRGGHE